jgi:uncharacterized membrane protein
MAGAPSMRFMQQPPQLILEKGIMDTEAVARVNEWLTQLDSQYVYINSVNQETTRIQTDYLNAELEPVKDEAGPRKLKKTLIFKLQKIKGVYWDIVLELS